MFIQLKLSLSNNTTRKIYYDIETVDIAYQIGQIEICQCKAVFSKPVHHQSLENNWIFSVETTLQVFIKFSGCIETESHIVELIQKVKEIYCSENKSVDHSIEYILNLYNGIIGGEIRVPRSCG